MGVKVKKLFVAITKNDFETVKLLLDKKPELINCICNGVKKYDGQSPLQVALKASNTQIIELLLAFGPDVNFIESQSCSNPWRAPVIHDSINRAIMCSRWNINRPDGIEVFNDKNTADDAFSLLEKLIEMGANVNSKDSYGNACIDRACMQARQILPRNECDTRILTPELKEDISRIFEILISHGADLRYISPNAFGKTYIEQYEGETVCEFLK